MFEPILRPSLSDEVAIFPISREFAEVLGMEEWEAVVLIKLRLVVLRS